MGRRGRLLLALAAIGVAIGGMAFAGASPRSLPVDHEPEVFTTTTAPVTDQDVVDLVCTDHGPPAPPPPPSCMADVLEGR